MKALLLIGLQVDLLPLGSAEIPGSDRLIPIANWLMDNFDLVLATNFTLPAEHKMFAANHLWRRPGQVIEIDGRETLLHTFFCIDGSFGSEFAPGLKADDIAFTAHMATLPAFAPHSAFYDEDKGRDTGLATFLEEKGVEALYLVGMPADIVRNTAIDALALGFDVHIYTDAVYPDDEPAIFVKLARTGVKLIATTGTVS